MSVSNGMTTFTQGYAILGSRVRLVVINMVNAVARFVAKRAKVTVALSNHALELAVKLCRIWKKGNTAEPVRIATTETVLVVAQLRTKLFVRARYFRQSARKWFGAVGADYGIALLSNEVVTFFRAVLSRFLSAIGLNFFSTSKTVDRALTAFPEVRFRSAVGVTRPATSGAEFVGAAHKGRETAEPLAAVQASPANLSSPPRGRVHASLRSLPNTSALSRTKPSLIFSVG